MGTLPSDPAPDASPRPFTLRVFHAGPHLLAELAGLANVATLAGAADMLAVTARLAGYRRLLVEMTAIAPELSFSDHLRLGMHAGAALEHLDKVATVVAPIVRWGVSERAAQLSGARLRTFTDLRAALDWIGSD